MRKIREVLGPDRSVQSAARLDPEGIRPDHHGQRRPRLRFGRRTRKREMGIVQVDENNLKPLIESFYARQ